MNGQNGITYNDADARPDFYKVKGFNPLDFLCQMTNDDGSAWLGLNTDIKKFWFRLVYPNGKIETNLVEHDEKHAIFNARIYADKTDSSENFLAEGKAIRYCNESDSSKAYEKYYIDYTETIALGRALTNAGFDLPWCNSMSGGISFDPSTGEIISQAQGASNPSSPSGAAAQKQYSAVTAPPNQNSAAQPLPNQQQSFPNSTLDSQAAPTFVEPQNYEEALKVISVEYAQNLIVTFGSNKGKTLGQIAVIDPGSLNWIANKYKGNDFKVRAAAQILLNSALNKAS